MKRNFLGLMLVFSIIVNTIVFMPITTYAASGTCGSNLTWTLDASGKLSISGSGDMGNYPYREAPWYSNRLNITTVIMEEGITSICLGAFSNCNNLISVTIPNSITSIGQNAFEYCYKLESITIPDGIKRIEHATFMDCHSLSSVNIPDSVTFIGDHAFAWCDLKSVVIPNSVTYIDIAAFASNKNLVYAKISNNVSDISNALLANNPSLETVEIPNNVTRIGYNAFYGTNLKTIIIPKSVKTICDDAFGSCNSLTDVYYSGSSDEWKNITCGSNNNCLTAATIHFSYSTPVSSVIMTSYSARLKVAETKQLCASVLPKNAANKVLSWSSNNTKVASVDSNGVVTAKATGTAIITAKSHNGKSASCGVTVQDSNIIDYDDFKYSFSNNGFDFGYPYHIEDGRVVWDYNIPKERYIQAGFEESVADMKGKQDWGGNCFGMSCSSLLFYMNDMHEERYNSNILVPFDFDAPNAGNNAILWDKWEVKLRHMIELFQASGGSKGRYFDDDCIQIMLRELEFGKPFVMRIDGNEGMHEIIIYGYTKTSDSYIFYIYDCSNFVSNFIYKNSNDWDFKYVEETDRAKYAWRPAVVRTYEQVRELYNNLYSIVDNSTSLFSATRQEPTYTHIFSSEKNMIITNSLSQTSTITDGKVSGEIEDIRVIPSSYLSEESTYTIMLPTDTYTIVGSGDEAITTSFADDYMSASVTAKSSTPITISSDLKEISVDTAADEEYDITYTTYDNIFDEMTLSGTATGAVTSKLNDADISISGVNTLAASASVSDSVVSTNSDNLSNSDEIIVKCEEADSGATIQVLSADAELTDKTSLPERLTVATPTYDLESGTYTEGQVLTFTKDDDTIVYYTTDGSIPSADNGIIYSLPIDINKSMTIKAISTKYGYLNSEIVELNYTLPEVDMPQANIESGEYDEVITVELSTGNYDDTVYYTLDSSNPLENGILYTVPINISEDTYLQAYTLRNGCISEISEYEYTVAPVYPFYFSNSLTNQDGEIITPDNIADVTKVKMTLSKLHTGDHTGVFLIAFYGADNRLIYVNYKTATIGEDIDEVEIDITEDVSSAYKVKAFAWKDLSSIQPICEALEENIIIE